MSDNNPLVSVIVPVYNVEKYLERCVNSIVKQTYENLEIILVDDGSPDGCPELCDKLKMLDNRISVFHKKNGGLSDARNCGIEHAKGAYITFIDSDDYVASTYIEYLITLLKDHSAEISCCCMSKTSTDFAEFGIESSLPKYQLITGKEACTRLFSDLYMVLVTAWGKLYSAKLVKDNKFPVGRTHEDEATTYKYYYGSNTVVVGHQELYGYFSNPTSITHSEENGQSEDAIWAMISRAEFFDNQMEKSLSMMAWDRVAVSYMNDDPQEKRKWRTELKKILYDNKNTVRIRLIIFLYLYLPFVYDTFKS